MTDGGGTHLAIGEVLDQLQGEFPDLTISKIRFFESQGLIDPERTPSGYRKFYPADVARLRWILGEQRDVSLQEIKARLERHDPAAGDLPTASAPLREMTPAPTEAVTDAVTDPLADVAADASPGSVADAAPDSPPAAPERPTPPSSLPAKPTPTPADRAAAAAPPRPAAARAQEQEAPAVPTPTPAPEEPPVRRRSRELTLPLVLDGEPATDDDGPDTFDRVALARATGVTEAVLDELESYGVIKPFHDDGIRAFFDRDALVCVQAAAALAKHGLQPRHLKMYVHFTEREGALFQQVIAPYLRQRNPVSRAKVDETLAELVTEARALRGALLRRAIEEALGD
ncbi:MAG: MerR family transcriptional regulator [Actinomycetota bacterium]